MKIQDQMVQTLIVEIWIKFSAGAFSFNWLRVCPIALTAGSSHIDFYSTENQLNLLPAVSAALSYKHLLPQSLRICFCIISVPLFSPILSSAFKGTSLGKQQNKKTETHAHLPELIVISQKDHYSNATSTPNLCRIAELIYE